MKKDYIFLVLLVLLTIFIFRNWLLPGVISSGDLRIFYPSSFNDYYLHPFAWDWQQANGLGGFESPFAWIYYDLTIPLLIGRFFNFSWSLIEKIFFLLPFLVVCFCSSLYLLKKLFPKNPFYLLGSFIYLLNTYIFMMVGGGQIVGISLAYAIFPLVLGVFIKGIDSQVISNKTRSSLINGLLFALLIFFDLRFAYMLALTVILYLILIGWKNWRNSIFVLISFVIAGLLHAFWVLPVLLSHQNPAQALGSAYNTLQSVQYFSFAKLENSISLLHPYWPENIFGKVGFMKPEYLILPIVAYSSLFFIFHKKEKATKEDKIILFFALLGLLGAFLAKGANDPFGSIYLWMFGHIPGFVMFRDPTKWYTLVAVSYSILIPFSVWKVYGWLSERSQINIQKYIPNIFVLLVVIFWLFTIRQAVLGQLGGTFRSVTIPSEYATFANYLTSQQHFSRTLWVPMTQRFAYSSANHPAVSAEDFFNTYDEKGLIKKLRQPTTEKLLQDAGVRYVIVPTDSQKEIFLQDRTYSEQLYKKTVSDVSKIKWLKPDRQITDLVVFEVPHAKDHFWIDSVGAKVSYKTMNQVEYKVSVSNVQRGDRLVFSESYDPHWVLTSSKYTVSSSKYNNILNSFILPQSGSYTLIVYYTPQKWVNIGVGIGIVTLVLITGSLMFLRKKF